MPLDKPESEKTPPIDFRKTEPFLREYSNHVLLENSAWDLKLTFGQTDQSISPMTVVQHSAITMPWSQVKVLTYFLQFHLLAHEAMLGHVPVPQNTIPAVPPPDKDTAEQFPNAVELNKALCKLRDEFMAANPEAMLASERLAK